MADKETSKIIEEQGKVASLTEHEGWPLVERMLMEKIERYYDTRNVKGKNATEKGKALEIRSAVAEEMLAWLQDIRGVVSTYEFNKQFKERETYIVRESA